SAHAMLQRLIAGPTDPAVLADWARGRLRGKREALTAARTGCFREHHAFLLSTPLEPLQCLEEPIAPFDGRLAAQMAGMGPPPSPAATPQAPKRQPVAEERTRAPRSPGEPPPPVPLHRAIGLLDPIPGIDGRTAETILAEWGTDMRPFPSASQA